MYHVSYKISLNCNYLPLRRRPGTGDIATPPSVCPSRLVFALSLENALIYFLKTLQVRAPCHGGVLYSFYIDGMLFEFCMNFLNIENKIIFRIFFQYFMFSSHFMLFPTFTKKNGVKKFRI